jgi:hypothetical protein
MGLNKEYLTIKWGYSTKKWYESKGYVFTNYGDPFDIKVYDLPNGSNIKVKIICDICEKELDVEWNKYINCNENNKYYCKSCKNKFHDGDKSFGQWCIENNLQNILEMWDYTLNKISPHSIAYATNRKYWFKCSKSIHNSELKSINSITSTKKLLCHKCNSFAQCGIEKFGKDFLAKYWDYDKNLVDPWEISYGCKINIWIKYQDSFNFSYLIRCCNFTNNPYAKNTPIFHWQIYILMY